MSLRSFRNHTLEIDFTSITRFLWPRPLELFLTARGCEPDGVCVRLQMRCSHDDDVATKRMGGARGYDIDGYWAIGDAEIDGGLHNNKLHEATVALRILHGRLVLECPPEKIIWAPGLYGPGIERKALGLGLRPLREDELSGASPTILALATASLLHTKETPTGLYCFNEAEEPKIRDIGLRLLDDAVVHYLSRDGIEYMPRVCLPSVSNLLKVLRDEIVFPPNWLSNAYSIINNNEQGIESTIEELRKLLDFHIAYHLPNSRTGIPYIVTTYPIKWIDRYLAMRYYADDPIFRIGQRGAGRNHEFEWKDLRDGTPFWNDAAAHGVGPHGLSIPLKTVHGPQALFSVSFSGPEEKWTDYLRTNRAPLIQVANSLHERAMNQLPAQSSGTSFPK